METERAKLEHFWRSNGPKMRSALQSPLLGRFQANQYRGIDVRHLHNKFGWQAGNNIHCAGAFYRTEAFMRLPDQHRCGQKKAQTVHIEHTVPIASIVSAITAARPEGPSQIITWLLARSITTGVADGKGPEAERRRIVRRGYARRTDLFTPGHADENLPFRRYDATSGTRIWDLVSRRPIDPDRFTMADHHANLKVALAWAALPDWSEQLAAIPA